MNKISDAVLQKLRQDSTALEAMKRGVLNFSAYAQLIHDQIESITHKPVQTNTITVALSRLAKQVEDIKSVTVDVVIESLNISSPLIDISYEKTSKVESQIAKIVSHLQPNSKFFAVTSGISEITIICSEELAQIFDKQITHSPKFKLANLASLTVTFSDKFTSVPNTLYSILTPLATNSVNIIEIVSTYTEITFVIQQAELDIAVSALKPLMRMGNLKKDPRQGLGL